MSKLDDISRLEKSANDEQDIHRFRQHVCQEITTIAEFIRENVKFSSAEHLVPDPMMSLWFPLASRILIMGDATLALLMTWSRCDRSLPVGQAGENCAAAGKCNETRGPSQKGLIALTRRELLQELRSDQPGQHTEKKRGQEYADHQFYPSAKEAR